MSTIGIDLGTTNSLVSFWNDGKPQLIPNNYGSFLTPSAIAIDNDNKVLVGQPAKEWLVNNSNDGVICFKRFMGTEKIYNIKGHTFSPTELSALVLSTLKEDAKNYFNEEISDAIISIPAYFNEFQRTATINAGKMAGLNVVKLITEPTAAALAYGLHNADAEAKFMVLDLGGGTFDVSILEMFEGVMEVRSIAGDVFLGGEDFNEAIFKAICEKENIDIKDISVLEGGQLRKLAEVCKKLLSDKEICKIEYNFRGTSRILEYSRNQFEKLVAPLILRLKKPIERALRDAKLNTSNIDSIILVGGATRMPIIRSVIGVMFSKIPFVTIHPDEAIALGIAVQAALKEKNEAVSELFMTDVCPYTLGISSLDSNENESIFSPILERNTCIPCSKVGTYSTSHNKQKEIKIEVYQGESIDLVNNLKLGEFKIKVPPNDKGKEKVDIRFTYDGNGLLEVEAKVLSTQLVKSYIIEKSPGYMTEQEIQERLKKLSYLKVHPRDKQKNIAILARADRLYQELLGINRDIIAAQVSNFKEVLDSQDERLIQEAYDDFEGFLNSLDSYNSLF